MAQKKKTHPKVAKVSAGDFSGLTALFINCTLKKSPEVSNTEGLAQTSMNIMKKHGIHVELIRAVDYDIATGVYPDMREHGWKTDEWPNIYDTKVMPADILILTGPIWLGDNSSIMKKTIERLYGNSSLLNKHGQYAYYGKVDISHRDLHQSHESSYWTKR